MAGRLPAAAPLMIFRTGSAAANATASIWQSTVSITASVAPTATAFTPAGATWLTKPKVLLSAFTFWISALNTKLTYVERKA